MEVRLLSKMTSSPEVASRVWEMGLKAEVFEVPAHRFAYDFIIDYWLGSRMSSAPTHDVMRAEYPQLELEDHVEESTDWLVGWLQRRFAAARAQQLLRDAARTCVDDPVGALGALWRGAYDACQVTAPRYTRVDVTETIEARRERYASGFGEGASVGVPVGLEEVDAHTRGVLPGELCAVAAYTKVGKSWLLANAFVSAMLAGLKPIMFTLEMGIPEMEDRIDALYSGVSYQRLSQRQLGFDELDRLRSAQDDMAALDQRGAVERPQRGERTVRHMVSRARQTGSSLLIVDQLSFIDAEREYSGDSALRMKHGDLIFNLKDEVASESAGKVACLLAVQLNRQSASANQNGRGELYNFANSSMVEQTVDLALGLWRNQEMRANNAMGLDIMGARRCDTRSWTLSWHLTDRTEIRVREEYVESDGGDRP